MFDRRQALILAGSALATGTAPRLAAARVDGPPTAAGLRAAAEYSRARRGLSMVVMHEGRVIFEDYPSPRVAETGFELASGTKSFNGVVAAAAVQDGLLTLDERVGETLEGWRTDPAKREVTIRQLLSLTSGLRSWSTAGDMPTYDEAAAQALTWRPGERFSYGAQPFQVFGAIMNRKLGGREDVVDYLQRRILRPIGSDYEFWRTSPDDKPHLPSGARFTARRWALFGEFVRLGGTWNGRALVDPAALEANFVGTTANPAYGLTWWLNADISQADRARVPQLRRATDVSRDEPTIPRDLVFAAGAGKQRLYVSRAAKLVVVRQASGINEAMSGGDSGGFTDKGFWRALAG